MLARGKVIESLNLNQLLAQQRHLKLKSLNIIEQHTMRVYFLTLVLFVDVK